MQPEDAQPTQTPATDWLDPTRATATEYFALGARAWLQGTRTAAGHFRTALGIIAVEVRAAGRERRAALRRGLARQAARVRSFVARAQTAWRRADVTLTAWGRPLSQALQRVRVPPHRAAAVMVGHLGLAVVAAALWSVSGAVRESAGPGRLGSPRSAAVGKAPRSAGGAFVLPPSRRIVEAPARPAPASTPDLPLATATPIALDYMVWAPDMPIDGGWWGAEQCAGDYYAPVGQGPFLWPTDDHTLIGWDFNPRRHPGLDLSAPFGAPIYAADAGVVVYAAWNTQGFGNVVILDHGNGWHSLYGHLSEVWIACGEAVRPGVVLGLSGSTGRSTGPHLHFEIRYQGGWVNPWDYLPAP